MFRFGVRCARGLLEREVAIQRALIVFALVAVRYALHDTVTR
ncbi:MAG: hypothetical protein WA373_02845 [Burkholderiales bacterium]